MKAEEFDFKGFKMNGFLALFFGFILLVLAAGCIVMSINDNNNAMWIIPFVVLILLFLISLGGYMQLEPNEARVMLFFGKYRGTFRETGLFWVNPFLVAKKLSLRSRNLNPEPIKVNDKVGNPVLIGLVMVWRLKDTYKAMFEIDSQTMAETGKEATGATLVSRMFTLVLEKQETYGKAKEHSKYRPE